LVLEVDVDVDPAVDVDVSEFLDLLADFEELTFPISSNQTTLFLLNIGQSGMQSLEEKMNKL
jgi:hypothetical protein